MTSTGSKPRLTRVRKLLLLAGAVVALGLTAMALGPAVPRPVTLDVVVTDPPDRGLRVRAVVTAEGQVEAELEEVVRGRGRVTLRQRLWLRPVRHRVEVRGRGCSGVERQFVPGEVERVVVPYACAVACGLPRDARSP